MPKTSIPETSAAAVLALGEPDRRSTRFGVAFGVLTAASAVGLLAASGYLIAAAALQPPILYLQMVIVGVRAFALGRAFFRYCERLVTHDTTFRTLGRLRAAVFAALIPDAPVNLMRVGRGDAVARLVTDIDEMQNLPLRVRQPLLTAGIVCGLSVLGVALISWPAALVLLGCLLGAGILGGVLPARLSARAADVQAHTRGRQFDDTVGFVDSQAVLAAYGAADHVIETITRHDRARFAAERRLAWGAGLSAGMLSAASGAAVLGALLVTAPAMTAGQLGGALMTMVVLVPMSVFEVFAMAPLALDAWHRVTASARRIAAIAPHAVPWSEVDSRDGAAAASRTEAPPEFRELQLRNAAVAWPGAAAAVADVTFTLTPGRRVVVSGASGTGKSTLAWALVGFLPVVSGEYRIDGEQAVALPGDELRRIVGLCEQNPHVFNSTVRANLHVADPDADDGALQEVLTRVGLWDDLVRRSGLDTPVGIHGTALSGGQVQRLALARALLARFPVIVFDEPTANVDPERAHALIAELLTTAAASAHQPAVVMMSHDAVPDELVDERIVLASRP